MDILLWNLALGDDKYLYSILEKFSKQLPYKRWIELIDESEGILAGNP